MNKTKAHTFPILLKVRTGTDCYINLTREGKHMLLKYGRFLYGTSLFSTNEIQILFICYNSMCTW